MDSEDITKSIDKIEESHAYKSGLKGAIDETGKALQTVGQAVNTVLLPIQGMIWGADQIKDWLNSNITKKLKDVKPEFIAPPNPHIAGPAIEALKFTAQEEELREMFATLLANSINTQKNNNLHPAFVDLIKSMNSIDARIMRTLSENSPIGLIDIGVSKKGETSISYRKRNVSLLGVKAKLEDPWVAIPSIENLERMGLCVIIKSNSLNDDKYYDEIQENKDVKDFIEKHTKEDGSTLQLTKGAIEISEFGRMFVSSCIT